MNGGEHGVNSLQLVKRRSSRLDGDRAQPRVGLAERRLLAGEERRSVVTLSLIHI